MSEHGLLSLLTAGEDAGKYHFLVTAKRSYRIVPGGRCEPSPEQVPLALEPAYHDARGQGGDQAPRTDPDVFCPLKPGTDLVVQATAYSHEGPVTRMEVSVGVGANAEAALRTARRLRVVGDRRVEHQGEGNPVRFTPPERFTTMPVRYDRAYGGRDVWAERTHPDPFFDKVAKHSFLGRDAVASRSYPRNPAGRGYLEYPDREAFAALELPNIELPEDPLTPESLCTGGREQWARAPLPGGFDWCEQSWVPRVAFLGYCPPFEGDVSELREVRTGYLPERAARVDYRVPANEKVDNRFFQGASPWLVLPTLRGDETVVLTGLHRAHPRLELRLPAERPQVLVAPPDRGTSELEPALRTVLVEPDEDRVVLVWSARLPTEFPVTPGEFERTRHAVRWKR